MVQIDMKMPNNCMVCPLLSYIPHENGDDEPVCYYTGDDLPEGYFHHDGGRPEFCPLKEQEAYRWRLCSDELPETEDEVLTTYIVNGNPKKRFVETASYFNDGDGYGHWNSIWNEYRIRGTKTEVIAWMPLPKPYKEGR